jgi:hypothetical protein
MELPLKKRKTLEVVLQELGIFPKEVWIHLLSQNKTLTINDIENMCTLNKTFKEICSQSKTNTLNIWEQIFIRKYTAKTLEHVKKTLMQSAAPLRMQDFVMYFISRTKFKRYPSILMKGPNQYITFLEIVVTDNLVFLKTHSLFKATVLRVVQTFQLDYLQDFNVPVLQLTYAIKGLENLQDFIFVVYYSMLKFDPNLVLEKREDVFDTPINSTIFCNQCFSAPIALKCSGCHGIEFCSNECGQAAWDSFHHLQCVKK